jgi:DnaJ-class molecular chaperone
VVRDNIRAIGITLQNLRQIERYGTSQMVDAAFAGFTAIPANAGGGTPLVPPQPWYDVLHVSPDAPSSVVEAAYRATLKTSHPDTGGSQEGFEAVQPAYREAQKR